MTKVVIIGNGISGVTAARHLRKRCNWDITIISAESKYFFSRTALMYVYMGHMKMEHTEPYEPGFWKKNRIDLLQAYVNEVDFKVKKIVCSSGEKITYDKLIIATGSKPNKFGWPGQDLPGVQGLYHKQDLENLENRSHLINTAVIIGGGLIGVELAEMLASRGKKVVFLVRESKFWGNVLPEKDAQLITKHILSHHIDLRFNEELASIEEGEDGNVGFIMTKKGEKINCEFVGLTAGVSPNISFLKRTDLATNRGVLVNQFLETSIEDVYAIGDCAEFIKPMEGRRPLEQVWYTGRMMGETVAPTILGERTKYQPGPWFNSAKFFDIEYQTYGSIMAEQQENELRYYWEKENKAIHLVYEKETNRFIGINTYGIRMRHELFDKWLKNKATVVDVLSAFKSLNFDPEFYTDYSEEILSDFESKSGLKIPRKKKSWKTILGL